MKFEIMSITDIWHTHHSIHSKKMSTFLTLNYHMHKHAEITRDLKHSNNEIMNLYLNDWLIDNLLYHILVAHYKNKDHIKEVVLLWGSIYIYYSYTSKVQVEPYEEE